MKSIPLITTSATTTLIKPFTNFFHLSFSPAIITLTQVITIIKIARKNANHFKAAKIWKNNQSAHVTASAIHHNHVPPHLNQSPEKFRTSQNIQLDQ